MGKDSGFRPGKDLRPSWSQFSHRFSSGRDCLAAFIALETAEVLAGVKPSTLLVIPDRLRACGRNLYRLWLEHGAGIMSRSCLTVRRIGGGEGYVQLLFYNSATFARYLGRRDVIVMLRKAGYREPLEIGFILDQLEERLKSERFPHDIGIFLGYPLKDVAAFMGWSKLPFACQGPWKMFGDPRKSLCLAEIYRSCRAAMARRLAGSTSPLECVTSFPDPVNPLFLSCN